ncbi:MAG: ATPase, T2SS/T4P/T4SS family, partial [Thermodesulfovibrionales bacterium]
GEVTIRELFRNSLRMRADRVIVGEVRGAEALDMLQAMCAGQNGSLAILHASSPWHVIYRLETMILTTFSNMTAEMIYRQIASAVHLIVHQEQMRDGSRRITHITQVRGMEAGEILLDDIFAYDMQGVSPSGDVIGRWRASGITPSFYPTMIRSGIALPQEIFQRD